MKSFIVVVILSLSMVACGGGDESISTSALTPRPNFINKFPVGEGFVEPLEIQGGKHRNLLKPAVDAVSWPASELYNAIRESGAGQKKDPLVRRYSSPIHSRSIVSSPTSPVANESRRAGQEVEPLIRRNPRPSNVRHSMDQALMQRNSAAWPSESYLHLARRHAHKQKHHSHPVSVAAASSISSVLAIVTDINQLSISENWVESPKSSSISLEHNISNLGISYNDFKSKVFGEFSSYFSLFLSLDTYYLYADDFKEEVKLRIYFNRQSDSNFCEKKFIKISDANIIKDEIINAERVVLLTNFDVASGNVDDFQKKEDESYFLIVFRRSEADKKWYKYSMVGDQLSWQEIEDKHFEYWFETGAQFVYFTSDELKAVRKEEQVPYLAEVQEEGVE